MNTNISTGLVILNMGNGKGKTTSALGMLLRSYGDGLRVGVLRFDRRPGRIYGEAISCMRLDIPYHSFGNPRHGKRSSQEKHRTAALMSWLQAQDWISSAAYDVLLLDGMTEMFTQHWLDAEDTVNWLKRHKPSGMHLVITGQCAPEELIEYADLVTEMKEIKSPLQHDLNSQAGVVY